MILASVKYQWSLVEDHKHREAFARLQVCNEFLSLVSEHAMQSHHCLLHYLFSFSNIFTLWLLFFVLYDLSMELSISPNIEPVSPTGLMGPLLARLYLKLGTWQWALSPGLDDDSVKGYHCYEFSIFFCPSSLHHNISVHVSPLILIIHFHPSQKS